MKPDAAFDRVRDAYDLEQLSRALVFVSGCGGSQGFAELLARTGVGHFVLCDFDHVALPNIGTQQVYRDEVEKLKVEVLQDRIHRINPDVKVAVLPVALEEITDEQFAALCGLDGRRSPELVLGVGMTDSFPAQARLARLGLKYGFPTLFSQLYAEGRGGEIVWVYPGLTRSCYRCATCSRFRAYLEEGYHNSVSSDGTPIFSVPRLDSLAGWIALAILHHGTAHPRWAHVLERIGQRNLIQIRMGPDLALPVFNRVLCGDPDRVFSDETVWLPQRPEDGSEGRPVCPDCGGMGDLRRSIRSIPDTRLTPCRQEVSDG